MPTNAHAKIRFRLVQDPDGYPPVAVEGLWATRTPIGYTLDNIPFFTREATLGDTVSAEAKDGELWFSAILARSRNSLLRVVLFDPSRVDEVRACLSGLGCDTEWDGAHKLIGVNVPGTANLRAVQEYLQRESGRGWLDYEEPILRP